MSKSKHPMAGKTVVLIKGELAGERFQVQDWFENVSGESWRRGNSPAACIYAGRVVSERLPANDRVVLGILLDTGRPHLAHDSELGGEVSRIRVALVTIAECHACGYSRQLIERDAQEAKSGFRFTCPSDGQTLTIREQTVGGSRT